MARCGDSQSSCRSSRYSFVGKILRPPHPWSSRSIQLPTAVLPAIVVLASSLDSFCEPYPRWYKGNFFDRLLGTVSLLLLQYCVSKWYSWLVSGTVEYSTWEGDERDGFASEDDSGAFDPRKSPSSMYCSLGSARCTGNINYALLNWDGACRLDSEIKGPQSVEDENGWAQRGVSLARTHVVLGEPSRLPCTPDGSRDPFTSEGRSR